MLFWGTTIQKRREAQEAFVARIKAEAAADGREIGLKELCHIINAAEDLASEDVPNPLDRHYTDYINKHNSRLKRQQG